MKETRLLLVATLKELRKSGKCGALVAEKLLRFVGEIETPTQGVREILSKGLDEVVAEALILRKQLQNVSLDNFVGTVTDVVEKISNLLATPLGEEALAFLEESVANLRRLVDTIVGKGFSAFADIFRSLREKLPAGKGEELSEKVQKLEEKMRGIENIPQERRAEVVNEIRSLVEEIRRGIEDLVKEVEESVGREGEGETLRSGGGGELTDEIY